MSKFDIVLLGLAIGFTAILFDFYFIPGGFY